MTRIAAATIAFALGFVAATLYERAKEVRPAPAHKLRPDCRPAIILTDGGIHAAA